MRLIELNTRGGYIAKAVARQRAAEAERTGLHCSTIVNDILTKLNAFKHSSETPKHVRFAYQEIGNVIEDVIAEGLVRRIAGWIKPDPKKFRAIIGSPDGWQTRGNIIHEVKATWVSERKFFEGLDLAEDRSEFDISDVSLKLYGFLMQALFYALAWGADRIYFHVVFLNGNYAPPVPNMRTFIIKFSQADLEQNYRNLAQHAIDVKLPGSDACRKFLKAA